MSIVDSTQNYSQADYDKCLHENPVLLYMKGTPKEPLCGFSKLVVDILQQYNTPFAFVNVLSPDIRTALKGLSKWPTFPQLYIQGRLIGGSDIILDLYQKGELRECLNDVVKY